MRNINKIIIHSSKTPTNMQDAGVDPAVPVNTKTLTRWAKDSGLPDIPYHYIILNNGTIEIGLNTDIIGGHTIKDNQNSLGICVIGGSVDIINPDDSLFSPIQYKALKDLITDIKVAFNINTIYATDEHLSKWVGDTYGI